MPTEANALTIHRHLSEVLTLLGYDLQRDESVKDTPTRWTKHLIENCAAQNAKAARISALLKVFAEPCMFDTGVAVTQGPIPFTSTCAHHVLPFHGYAWVSYIPSVGLDSKQYVFGLSKLTRAVQYASKGLNTQERITDRIVNAIENHSMEFDKRPKGVAVVLRAEHMCMACRGVNVRAVHSVTQRISGLFETNAAARSEFYSIVNNLQP